MTPEILADLERRLEGLSAELKAERVRSARLLETAAGLERQRIAQLLHDTVCQSLSGASLEAAVLTRELEAKGSGDFSDLKALRGMIRNALKELHDLVGSLQEEPGDSTAAGMAPPAEIHRDEGIPRI